MNRAYIFAYRSWSRVQEWITKYLPRLGAMLCRRDFHDWRYATSAPGSKHGDECGRCQRCKVNRITHRNDKPFRPEDQDGPWVAEEVGCEHCGREWVSVHPCALRLECPSCYRMTRSTWAIQNDQWMKEQV